VGRRNESEGCVREFLKCGAGCCEVSCTWAAISGIPWSRRWTWCTWTWKRSKFILATIIMSLNSKTERPVEAMPDVKLHRNYKESFVARG